MYHQSPRVLFMESEKVCKNLNDHASPERGSLKHIFTHIYALLHTLIFYWQEDRPWAKLDFCHNEIYEYMYMDTKVILFV